MTDSKAGSRRTWLVGGAALLAGVGAALWRWQEEPAQPQAMAEVWALKVLQPDGQMLSLASMRGKPLLLNFWATWCPPCVEELPMIDAFWRQHGANGMQVLALAVDRADAVKAFLGKHEVQMPVGILGPEGVSLAKNLGNAAGGLPFSVFLSADGKIYRQKLGKLSEKDLDQWLQDQSKR